MGLRRSFKPTNLIQNGDFSNRITGWTAQDAAGIVSNIYFSPLYALKCTSVATSRSTYLRQPCTYIPGHVHYRSYRYFIESWSSGNIFLQVGNQNTYASDYSVGEWLHMSAVSTQGASSLNYTYCGVEAGTSVVYFDNLLAIDLTALCGSGNEPTKEWCDLNIPVWFDGTLSGGSFSGMGGLK